MQSDPLKDLRDIHLPEAGGFWPPAPGWWLLAAVLLALTICLAVWWRRHRRNAWLRQAIRELDDIRSRHKSEDQKLKHLNQLLKRSARARYPDRQPETLTGDQWVAFLLETGPHKLNNDESALRGLVESSWRPDRTVSYREAEHAARSWLGAQSC